MRRRAISNADIASSIIIVPQRNTRHVRLQFRRTQIVLGGWMSGVTGLVDADCCRYRRGGEQRAILQYLEDKSKCLAGSVPFFVRT